MTGHEARDDGLAEAQKRARSARGHPAMQHEPRWSIGQCTCGAPLGDQIDWTWHLANAAIDFGVASAYRKHPKPETTDEAAEEWIAYGRGVPPLWMLPEPKGPNYATHQRTVKAGPWVPIGEGEQ